MQELDIARLKISEEKTKFGKKLKKEIKISNSLYNFGAVAKLSFSDIDWKTSCQLNHFSG
jgi:hypothetical protein